MYLKKEIERIFFNIMWLTFGGWWLDRCYCWGILQLCSFRHKLCSTGSLLSVSLWPAGHIVSVGFIPTVLRYVLQTFKFGWNLSESLKLWYIPEYSMPFVGKNSYLKITLYIFNIKFQCNSESYDQNNCFTLRLIWSSGWLNEIILLLEVRKTNVI